MAATVTIGELRKGATSWVRTDLNRSIRVGAIAFGVSWLINFIVITTWGAGFGNLVGAATEGTEAAGAAYMAIMSLTVSSLVVYGIEAGWSDLRRSFVAIPKALGRMFREHGIRMWSIVFWGGAVTLLTSGILDPTLSAAFGLGFLAFAPTAVTGLLGKLITGIWTAIIGLFAPRTKPRTTGLGGQLVGVIGAATGFLVASQATETAFQLIAAGVLAALSYFVLMNSSSRTATSAAFLMFGVAFWIAGGGIAHALQPCCTESHHHHPLDPGMKAAGLSALAGLAGGVAGVIGAGIGSVLAAHPQNPADWDDSGDSTGLTVTSDPIPDGPTRPTTITLEGDAARAALDAWQRAKADGGQVDLPLADDDQWDATVTSAEGDVARSGHVGIRGRVTNIGPVVEGADGSISISVDVTAYHPPAPAPPVAKGIVAAGTSIGTPPGGIASGVEAAGAAADTPQPPPGADGARPDAVASGPSAPMPDVGDIIAETTAPTRQAPAGKLPDGRDPGAYAEWLGRTATGTLPPGDVASLRDLIFGERTEVTLSGTATGPWAPLLSSTENRTDGIAVRLPTGDRVLVRVRDGRVEVKHEGSLLSVFTDGIADSAAQAGMKLPKVEDLVAGVRPPLDAFNRSIATSGRQVESLTRNPDGSITIKTRS